MPHPAMALLQAKLTPAAFDRAVALAEPTAPADAVARGWLDQVVEPDDVMPTARAVAAAFAGLDRAAHLGSKLRARAALLAEVRRGTHEEFGESS